MSLTFLIVAFAVVGVATLLARMSFSLATPAKVLLGVGMLGAVFTMFTLDPEVDANSAESSTHWLAPLGTMMSLAALLGLLALVLIWAIRRWGIRHDDNPDEYR